VVSLYVKGDNSSWTFVKNAMTDSNGYYRFSDLTLGTYRVVETQPTNYTDGKETLGKINGTAVGTVGADKFDNIALGAGEDGVGYNFGERGLKLSKLSAKYFLASYITGPWFASPPLPAVTTIPTPRAARRSSSPAPPPRSPIPTARCSPR
jgi:hypothetical protein